MASSSGIKSNLSDWINYLIDPKIRILKIQIEEEKLKLAVEIKIKGTFEEDFNLIPTILTTTTTTSYIIYRIDSNSFIFYNFVSDLAPVKFKMLYASTKNDLLKTLNFSNFKFINIFASNLDDLTYKSYLAHLNHLNSSPPLSIREQEILEIKANELKEQQEGDSTGRKGRSMIGPSSIGLEWSSEAQILAEEFEKGEKEIFRLEIDTAKENVIPASEQPTSLSLPTSTPAYTFYRHSGRVVFIYSCPPSSPIKSRLLYSSSANGVSQTAKSLGISVIKKIESSSPEEIDDSYILEELSSIPILIPSTISATSNEELNKSNEDSTLSTGGNIIVTSSAPLPLNDEKTFSKPSRPGRKR